MPALIGSSATLEKGAVPATIADQAKLPRVLLLGDSISQGYTLPVCELLDGKANVHQADWSSTPDKPQSRQEPLNGGKWAVIHFNCGLHDLKYWKDGQMDLTGPRFTSMQHYEKNLHAMARQLRATRALFIWASTTPVPKGANGRVVGDYNALAARVMREEKVPINDLHTVASKRSELQYPENVHFTEEDSRRLAKKVAEAILGQLNAAAA